MGVGSQNQSPTVVEVRPARRRPPATHRAERMAGTRRTIIDVGMALFAEHGFDATTTQQIASRAGVSTSTFFRYFPTKESLLFVGEYDYTAILCDAFARQPPALSEREALFAAFVELAPMMAAVRDRVRLYEQAVASSVLLRGREAEHHDANVTQLARAIAARRGERPTPSAHLVAQVALATLHHSHTRWLAGPADTDLVTVIKQDHHTLREMLR